MHSILQQIYRVFEVIKYKLGFVRHYILPRKFYTTQEILDSEYKHIFYSLWIFAGLTLELKTPKTWLRKKIGKKEILITQNNGQLFAVENVCPHKNIKLFDEDFGEKPLVCRYHAWSFNADGSNRRIPHHDRSYKFGSKQMEMSCLTKYEITTIGIFIFIKLNSNKFPIEKQFPPEIISSLKHISPLIGEKHHKFSETRKFNWKLNFENLKDALHPAVLHAKTLAPLMDFSAQHEEVMPLNKMLKKITLPEASYFAKDGETTRKRVDHLDGLILQSLDDGYYNWVLFPTFHMASPDGGKSYSLEVHSPVSFNATEIRQYILLNKPLSNDALLEEIIEHRTRGLKTVMEEDYIACEKIQEALAFTDREQNIGAYEYYNVNIATLYRKIIKK